ncbi:MAG: ubiquinol-cytochrome c reductase [Porticoccaceae bacterium]|nr:MAG: ubiquinol-cytochrome c reductase [Porticoccaceae bacterium]
MGRGLPRGALKRRLALSLTGLRVTASLAAGSTRHLFAPGEERRAAQRALLAREARRLAAQLGRLKGAYAKWGQLLALHGRHLLPAEVVREFEVLTDRVEPLPFAAVEEALESHLGARRRELEVEPRPIAAASLGQVHRARHRPSGRLLCLKIRYPGVAEATAADFRDLRWFAAIAEKLGGGAGLTALLEELARLVEEELDYRREALCLGRVAELAAGEGELLVPKPWPRYCSEATLALDWVEGVRLDSPEAAALPRRARNRLGRALFASLFRELFRWRLWQTDPNLGNYLAAGARPVRLALLDFGAFREVEEGFAAALARVITAAVAGDRHQIARGLEALGFIGEDQSERSRDRYAAFCELLAEPLRLGVEGAVPRRLVGRGGYRFGASDLVQRAARAAAAAAASPDFAPPPAAFALLVRRLSGLFGALQALDAEFDPRFALALLPDQSSAMGMACQAGSS